MRHLFGRSLGCKKMIFKNIKSRLCDRFMYFPATRVTRTHAKSSCTCAMVWGVSHVVPEDKTDVSCQVVSVMKSNKGALRFGAVRRQRRE